MRVGAPDDHCEHQANFVATQVTRGSGTGPALPRSLPAHPGSRESSDTISSHAQSRIDSAQAGGRALPATPRQFFESRFGTDFRSVRIHDDPTAAAAARDLRARAFTIGRDVFFGANQFSPQSQHGRKLLAHELTHVLQQGGPNSARRGRALIQRTPDERSQIEEHVSSVTRRSDTDIIEGTVQREEFAPASGDTPRRSLGSLAGVRIRFDPTSCEVVLPTKVHFEHPSASNWPRCGADTGSPVPPNPLSDGAFRSLANRVLTTLNEDLNGWYTVRMSDGPAQCADRDMPIRVDVSEVTSAAEADTIVVLANKRGRSCAGPSHMTIHALGASRARLAHEGLHTVLGVPDEYPPEREDTDRDPASVRTDDLSRASRHDGYAEWGLLHTRHFAFVPAFLEHIYPGSSARLQEKSRPTGVDWHFSGALSYANLAGGSGIGYRVGLDLGIPLDRQREWQVLIGAHAQMLLRFESPMRAAFLGGLRLGFLGQPHLSEGGLRMGAFVGGGVGAFNPLVGTDGSPNSSESTRAGFAELGGSIGYNWSPSSAKVLSLGADFSAGTSLGIPPAATGESREVRFFQLGLRAAIEW